MRVEVLSDHGGQELRRTERRLLSAEAELAARQGSYRHAWDDLRSARHGKSLWKRMFSVQTPAEREALTRVRGTWQDVVRAGHGRQRIDQRARQQAAGNQGEDALTAALSVLSDEWTMLRGYHNGRGETDHVLIGPRGVWAVEVKNRRVRLHAVADEWWFERFDRRGRVVGREAAVDGGGRSWGRQVSDVADGLAAWLAGNGQPVRVHTAVLLMHEHAVLGRCAHLAVSLLCTRPTGLLRAMAEQPAALSPAACAEIVRLARADHVGHARRRRDG